MTDINYSTAAFEEDQCYVPKDDDTGVWNFEFQLNSGVAYYQVFGGEYKKAKMCAMHHARNYLGCSTVELVPGA
jgi:hypothetical protein